MLVHILLTEYVVRVYAQCIVMDMESRLTLLGLLSAGPGHGYDLKRSWDHWFAASKPLAYGQVYATLARLVRDGVVINGDLSIETLRREKDDVTEVREGYECGINLGFKDLAEGDVIETWEMREKPRD